MPITPDVLARHGLKQDEYARIVDMLGREPNMTELGMFSVMWSEHCSYKSSRIHLKTLPTQGPRVLQGPGENAGAVDIGDGFAAVFKIESHNHPSFIEPYQGAATGVGGIIRDIFTMGARPIALLDSLRFGDLSQPGTRRVVRGVVAGIAGYGNSIGIPTVGGEAAFDPCYAGNPLVNVFCLGIAPADGIVKGRADGVGNAVYYVGASTGRDGIHGATMASAEFDDASAEKRPAVQVGDPFMEKLLLEACLEVLKTGALVGLQDMGAAGLSCATSEMSARGHMGMDVEVTKVPQRETGMTPYEIMLSESQERMLFVVHKGREAVVEEIFEKWDLHAVCIGHVTDDGLVRVREHGVVVAEVPARALADEAPLYDRPSARPAWLDEIQTLAPSHFKAFPETADVLRTLLASPTIASKKWIYRQYDHMVRTNTLCLAGQGTPVVRVKGTTRALAMSVDGNGRYGQTDPKRGAMLAVAEAARNVALAGGEPLGATNNLNFGNPEKPEIMWQFVEAVQGIGEACRAFGIPITGGNVSLYNETDGKAIHPTPVLGVVGLVDDASKVIGQAFPSEGLQIVMLGETRAELGATEYLQRIHGELRGLPPAVDLEHERALQVLLPALVSAGLVASAHDCAEGGLAVALAECTFGGRADSAGRAGSLAGRASSSDGRAGSPSPAYPIGATVSVAGVMGPAGVPVAHATLFSESAGRVLLAVTPANVAAVLDRAAQAGVAAAVIGTTGGTTLDVRVDGQVVLSHSVAQLRAVWANALEDALASPAR